MGALGGGGKKKIPKDKYPSNPHMHICIPWKKRQECEKYATLTGSGLAFRGHRVVSGGVASRLESGSGLSQECER